MDTLRLLADLIAEGERLAPKGGTPGLGYNGELQPEYAAWRHQAIAAIQELGPGFRSILRELEQDENGPYFYSSSAEQVLGAVKGAQAILARKRPENSLSPSKQGSATASSRVFVVHGRDEAILQQVARFLEALDLTPIVLFEQPAKGRTVIEKLERESDVAFAIVLLTPDDVGSLAGGGQLHPRARQNVVLELGFFLGKLGRSRVAVLYDESVELPSDYRGVEYIKLDAEGAWKLTLAREIKAAGFLVDMNKAV